jgi:hypothetical protein
MTEVTPLRPSVHPVHPDAASTVRRRYVAPGGCETGECVYGVPSTGQIDPAGAGEFLGITLASVQAGRPVWVLARGKCHGFAVRNLPIRTPLYESDMMPGGLSTIPSTTRPAPLATVTTIGGFGDDQTPVIDIHGYVDQPALTPSKRGTTR